MTTTPLGAQWLGSPNFTPGRAGHTMAIQPAYVVLHTMVGTIASANARFQDAAQQASATYGVGLDGRYAQWVSEQDAAWANGATGRGGAGDNLDSVSIEHEDNGDYNGPRTPALYNASARLVRDVCQRYGVPIDRQHVLKHSECAYAQTACPDALDVDWITAHAASGIFDRGGQAALVIPGDDMGPIAFRPGDSATQHDRYDRVLVLSGQLHRYWGDSVDGLFTGTNADGSPIGHSPEGAPPGLTLIPGTAVCGWSVATPTPGAWCVCAAVASDGNMWGFRGTIDNGNETGWKMVQGSAQDLPAAPAAADLQVLVAPLQAAEAAVQQALKALGH